ncbi:MAG: NAD(P)H-dependent oxidoreductase [Balneola sp.]|jgi:nitroreductase|nr:NAD(P)H-dependent oxidoreductase [Balneola sp.]MBE78132.1 NAD(P)H-dependent oxidoreductase [Balneola sp.]|tara:strand:+ start:975 stop:1619 length:645 start_codon:yes stop_codon:yes gene_type:complete
MEFQEALKWRYATKKMNGDQVPEEKLDNILEAIRMAPTSIGLQPFTVIHIQDQEIKEKIKPIAYGQPQITESSDLLVFAAWNEVTQERIDNFVELTGEIRDLNEEELKPLRDMADGVASRTIEEQREWSARQAYIALGFGLSAAAIEEVDASPMEGFKNEELDEFLDLESKGLHSVSLMALGYRDEENDWLAPMKKVRRPKDELFIEPNVPQMA